MKNLKKFLAIFLSIAMVMCSALPNFASANDASSESTEFVEETHDEPAEEEAEESESDYAEEPEEDETTAAVEESEEDETTVAVEESEEDETTAAVEESEEDETTAVAEEETSMDELSESAELASPSEINEKVKSTGLPLVEDDRLLGDTAEPWMYYYIENGNTIRFTNTNKSGATGVTSDTVIAYSGFDKSDITRAIFDNQINAVTCDSFFKEFEKLETIDNLEFLITEEVDNMENMFFKCESLESLNLSNFNTLKVTSMYQMFEFCDSLTVLDLSSFNTANLTDMQFIFNYCDSLETIIVSDTFVTDKVSDSSFFRGSTKLIGCNGTVYDESKIDKAYARIDEPGNPGYFSKAPWMYWYLTDNDTIIHYTKNKPMSGGNGPTRRDIVSYRGLEIDKIDKAIFDDEIDAATCKLFFSAFVNLKDIIDLDKLKVSQVTSMEKMFYDCRKLKVLDLSSFNTSNVVNMKAMFRGCSILTTIIVSSSFDITKVSGDGGNQVFMNCWSLRGCNDTGYVDPNMDINYARIDGGSSAPGYFSSAPWMYWYLVDSDGDSTYETIKYTNSEPTSGDYGFVTRRDKVVYNDLTKTDITNAVFDIDVNAVTCTEFFKGFTNLKEVQGIGKLKKEATKKMHRMFLDCSSLKNIDLRDFDVGNVAFVDDLFYGCSSLETVYLGEKVTIGYDETSTWFYDCTSLTTIYVLNDNFSSLYTTSNMFYNCTNLVGGAGTTYDSSRTDSTYAHIDGGTANPGYFTFYDPLNPPSPPSPPSPGPTPYYPSGGGSGGSSGSSGGSGGGGGGGGGGGPVTEDVPAVTYLPYVKSIIGFANNLMSKWSQDAMSSKWKLSVTAENGLETNFKNGFVLYTHISTQIVGNETVQTAANNTYVFDENGNMITGWVHTSDGKTYFFENKKTNDEGKMIIGWKQVQGSWYYFGADGTMYTDTVTPDGHPVGPDGKWRG